MVFFDRVKETSAITGTGVVTLTGAPAGFRSFASVLSVTDVIYYCIQGQTPGEWETGIGTYSAANTLTRTTPLAGSAATPVSFSAGIKDVFITVGATYFGSVVDHTADGSGYVLSPGESIFKTFSAATSIPLYVTTAQGIYDILIVGDRSVSVSNNNSITLSPNGTTYSNAIRRVETYNTTGSTLGGGNSLQSEFKLSEALLVYSIIKVFTFTTGKAVQVNNLIIDTGPTLYREEESQTWEDTTTVWSSLGTLTFPFAQSGTILIKRVL